MKFWKISSIILFFIILGFIIPFIYSGIFWPDSESIFNLSDRSFYLKANYQASTSHPFRDWQEPDPDLSAQIVLLADIDTNFVFYQKMADFRRPIASVSKMMSAIITKEYIPSEKQIEILPKFMSIEGDRHTFMKPGEFISAIDLQKMMLLSSSNKAAVALTTALPKNEFVRSMNEKAAKLGMLDSNFVEPTGLSMANQSTALDLQKLMKYILNNHPEIISLTQETEVKISSDYQGESSERKIININRLSGEYLSFFRDLNITYLGGKTGFTDEAKETYAGVFSFPDKKDMTKSRRILVIVLFSDSRYNDIEKLLRWLDKAYIF